MSEKLNIGESGMGLVEEDLKKIEITFENKSFYFSHLDENDHIYSIIKKTGEFYEQEMLSALRPLLGSGDWIVDAGANMGNHSVFFAGVCGCNVIAFEPNPVAASILRKNVELNGLESQVQVHEIALGSQAGTGTIVSPNEHNLGMAEIHKAEADAGRVQIGLLSDYVGSDRIRLIKIDVEGMDLEVLRGAVSVIERDRSVVTIEASSRVDFLRIFGMLEPYGYTAAGSFNYTPTHLFIEDDGSQPHRTLSLISRQLAMDYIDHAALRDALNNGLRQARTQRDQLSRAFSEIAADLPVKLTQARQAIAADLRDHVHSELAALETRLTGIETAVQAVAQLSETVGRSDARLGAIEQAIARRDRKQAAREERLIAALSASTEMISALQGNLETMAQLAVMWAETGHLQDAAQKQAQAQLQRDIDRIKQQTAGKGAVDSGATIGTLSVSGPEATPAAIAPSGKGSVWRVVRRDAGLAPDALQHVPERVLIADETYSDTWDSIGWASGEAALDPGGVVRATGDAGAGFVTRTYPFAGGGLLEVEIDIADAPAGAARPGLAIVSNADEGIGPEIELQPGITTVRAFAPGRTQSIKLRIHARTARTGDSFAVRRLTVRQISPDAHQRDVRARIGEPVLASMASIPSRRSMLADTVNSLLAQCDRVRVFLNNYPDVPDFLMHPRVDVRRSQDWDDRGDAGKMFWLEHDKQPGYRLIVDDDLIFPPDFSVVMCGKVAAKGKRAIYATHGVLLRQPIDRYYAKTSRAVTFHFSSSLPADRLIHVATTGCTCFYASAVELRWADFKYCNSADIWLTIYAQTHGIQVFTPSRPRFWIRENKSSDPTPTIYQNSLMQTRTRFDSSLVQDAVLKHNWPLSINVGDDHKYALMLTFDSIEGLGVAIERFLDQATSEAAELVVMLAYDRSDSSLEEAVAGLRIERETHLIDTAKGDALTQAAELREKTGIAALLAVEAESLTGASDGEPLTAGKPVAWGGAQMLKLKAGKRKGVAGVILVTGKDEADSLLALVRELRLKPSGVKSAFASIPAKPHTAPVARRKESQPTINSVFECVRVLNLDRRPDRWESVSRSLALAGVQAERFSAVDGSLPEVAAEYEAYLQKPPVEVSDAIPPIASQHDFYMDYASQMARIAHLERAGKKAIASRGAWGYLKSMETVLEEALADNTESLLIFDDDVMLHKDTKALFAEAMAQAPDDWMILQLGTLQYNWTPPWAEWHSPRLYRTNGSAIGSHAVGLRFEVIPYLLDQVKRFDMPYDIGALSAATRAFAKRCFVISPNLAIQSLVDSDIGTSDFQRQNKREQAAATYKWNLEDYR